MPHSWADFVTQPDVIAAAACSVAAVIFGGAAYSRYRRSRPTADELERRRRTEVNSGGKICDGEIIEVEGPTVIFSYSVAGVEYTAAQDVTEFEARLPEDVMSMVGPVTLKYDPRNPANSIVICEQWSGIRKPQTRFPMAR